MNKIAILLVLLFICSCGKSVVEKPERLIEEDRMVDIFYDLALLEAMRTQKPLSLTEYKIDPDTFIYEKYKIDSTQFAQSNRYYASQIDQYKKMYARVGKRLQNKLDVLAPEKSAPSPIKNAAK